MIVRNQRVKLLLDQWVIAAGIESGSLFRSVNKGDRVGANGFTENAVWGIRSRVGARRSDNLPSGGQIGSSSHEQLRRTAMVAPRFRRSLHRFRRIHRQPANHRPLVNPPKQSGKIFEAGPLPPVDTGSIPIHLAEQNGIFGGGYG